MSVKAGSQDTVGPSSMLVVVPVVRAHDAENSSDAVNVAVTAETYQPSFPAVPVGLVSDRRSVGVAVSIVTGLLGPARELPADQE